jgi:urease accessory protein UreE
LCRALRVVKNLGTNKEDSATTDDTGRFKVATCNPEICRHGKLIRLQSDDQQKRRVEVGRETNLEVALSLDR